MTVLNVVREKSREIKRSVPLTWEIESTTTAQEPAVDSVNEGCFLAVIQAFNNLKHEERKIIQLRYFEKYEMGRGEEKKYGRFKLDPPQP